MEWRRTNSRTDADAFLVIRSVRKIYLCVPEDPEVVPNKTDALWLVLAEEMKATQDLCVFPHPDAGCAWKLGGRVKWYI